MRRLAGAERDRDGDKLGRDWDCKQEAEDGRRGGRSEQQRCGTTGENHKQDMKESSQEAAEVDESTVGMEAGCRLRD